MEELTGKIILLSWRTPYGTSKIEPSLKPPISPTINTGKKVVRGKRTCTADVAQVLRKRNLLRVAESIRLSPNGRFCSIKFKSTEIMQTFCTEALKIIQYISSLTINLNQNENHTLLSPF